jgi:hypothetical protein
LKHLDLSCPSFLQYWHNLVEKKEEEDCIKDDDPIVAISASVEGVDMKILDDDECC